MHAGLIVYSCQGEWSCVGLAWTLLECIFNLELMGVSFNEPICSLSGRPWVDRRWVVTLVCVLDVAAFKSIHVRQWHIQWFILCGNDPPVCEWWRENLFVIGPIYVYTFFVLGIGGGVWGERQVGLMKSIQI